MQETAQAAHFVERQGDHEEHDAEEHAELDHIRHQHGGETACHGIDQGDGTQQQDGPAHIDGHDGVHDYCDGIQGDGGMHAAAHDAGYRIKVQGSFSETQGKELSGRFDFELTPFSRNPTAGDGRSHAHQHADQGGHQADPVRDATPDHKGAGRENGHISGQTRQPPGGIPSGDEHIFRGLDFPGYESAHEHESEEVQDDDDIVDGLHCKKSELL